MQTARHSLSSKASVTSWSIRDLAREFDVTPRAIRFYEDKGLLSPRREGSSRVFLAADRERLTHILRAKRMGFSLDDIKEVFDVMDGEVLGRAELLRRKANFEAVISSLERRQSDIDIIRQNLSQLCRRIQTYVDDPALDANILQFAHAYDAALRGAMDDDFSEEAPSASSHTDAH